MLYNSMITRNITEAIYNAIYTGECKRFGADSISGTMIRVKLNSNLSSPFISTNLSTMGKPFDSLLLKLVCIHPNGGSIRYGVNMAQEKTLSTKDDFVQEVSIQQDIYTKTNMLGESLCPAIVGAFIVDATSPLIQILKKVPDVVPLIARVESVSVTQGYRFGLIAMELLEGYDTLHNKIQANIHQHPRDSEESMILSAYYAFARLCSLGYRHNDLHANNMMINTSGTDYAGSRYPRAMIIDFGRTHPFGTHNRSLKDIHLKTDVSPAGLNDLYDKYVSSIRTDGYIQAGENFYFNLIPSVMQQSFKNNIATYILKRRERIEDHLRNNLYDHPNGIQISQGATSLRFTPIQYKNTGNTLQSFREIISRNTTRALKLFNLKGIDFDIVILIQKYSSNPNYVTVGDYYNSQEYTMIVNNKYLPSTLYKIVENTIEHMNRVNQGMQQTLLQLQQERQVAIQERQVAIQERQIAEQERQRIEQEKQRIEKEKELIEQEKVRLESRMNEIEKGLSLAARRHIKDILDFVAESLRSNNYTKYIPILDNAIVTIGEQYASKYKNKLITNEMMVELNNDIIKEIVKKIGETISSSVANKIIVAVQDKFGVYIPMFMEDLSLSRSQSKTQTPVQRTTEPQMQYLQKKPEGLISRSQRLKGPPKISERKKMSRIRQSIQKQHSNKKDIIYNDEDSMSD
jgi:hypothetical protein